MSDDRPLVHDDRGGDGPPVLFGHDVPPDRELFEPLVRHLGDVYRTVTWQPREPETPDAVGPDHWWDAARQLFTVLDDLGIERAVLVGSAGGGELAVRAGLLHPDRVRALVLIDTTAADDDVADRLDELAMPVVVLHGTADPHAVLRAHEIGQAVSDPRGVVEVVGAGEAPALTHYEVVTPAIRAFLEGLPA